MNANNLYQQYKGFIEAYRAVSRYAVDLSLLRTDEMQYPRENEIGEDEFFEKLYIKRDQEEIIRNALLQSPDFILLIGEAGSGKTCTCLSICRELEKRAKPKTLVTTFDIRLEGFYLPPTALEPQQIDTELLDRLREKYLDRVFPYQEIENSKKGKGSSEIPLLRLVAYIVDPNQVKPRGFEFETISIELRLLYNQYLKVHNDPNEITYYDWLVAEHIRDERISNFIRELLGNKRLALSFLMHATHAIYAYEKQVIWIDDIDTLSTIQQSRLFTVIRQLSRNVSQIANVIVSVRDGNVYKKYEFDESQAHSNQTYVNLYTSGYDETPALELAKVTLSEVKQIIHRRISFAIERYNKLVSGQLKLSSGGQEDAAIELNSNNSSYQQPIERSTYENILSLSNRIFDIWEIVQAPLMENNSIRGLLSQHSDFMGYLLNSAIESHKQASQKQIPHPVPFPNFSTYGYRGMTTQYFAWIRRGFIRENTIGFYDIIRAKDSWLESNKTIKGDSLDHLIITAIWNLTLRNPIFNSPAYKIPQVRQVIEKLEGLGYDRKAILRTMNSLYHGDEIRTHFIDIQSKDSPLKALNFEEIQDEYLVYVTPRGKSVSRYLINTFGYVFECVLNSERNPNKSTDSYFTEFLEVDEKKAIDFILPHLYDVADMYIQTLIKIRDGMKLYGGKDWIKKYLDDFGTPVHSSDTLGEIVNGSRKALLFEIMLDGILRFTELEENIKRLSVLFASYKDLIEKIRNYEESDVTSIRDSVNL